MKNNKPVVTQKYEFEYQDESKVLKFQQVFDCSVYLHSDARNKTDYFSMEWFATFCQPSIGTPVEEMEPVLMES